MMCAQCLRLVVQRLVQVLQRRDQPVLHLLGAGDVHGGRIGVVRRLAHVDVVVGVHGLLGAHLAAQHLDGAVGDHLVGIHVGLGAGARLPDDEREVLVELAVDHLLRGLDDGLADGLVEAAQRHVGFRRGALDDAERAHHGQRLLLPADLEIAERALRLRAPVFRGIDLDGAEGVGLGAGLGHGSPRNCGLRIGFGGLIITSQPLPPVRRKLTDACRKNLPRGIWMLGFVSLFMDVSSEMIHAILPLFVVGTLGASAALLGLLEGIAEATAQISKLFSGVLSDRWGSRKGLALLGYGMAAVVKPLFPLATSVTAVFAARFADRVGKGIRGAPRDALVADIAPPELRGAAFGLRQSLDTVGAFAGPLIAIAADVAAGCSTCAPSCGWPAFPPLIAVALLAFGVEEPPHRRARPSASPASTSAPRRSLGPGFWQVTAVGAAMMMARFSEAFLVLKARRAGSPTPMCRW